MIALNSQRDSVSVCVKYVVFMFCRLLLRLGLNKNCGFNFGYGFNLLQRFHLFG